MEKSAGIEIVPTSRYCPGKLFKARLENLDCAIVVPCVSGYPEDVIEIVASENLKEHLHLIDGSNVTVEVTI